MHACMHARDVPNPEMLALFSTRKPNTARSGEAGLQLQEAEAELQGSPGLQSEFMVRLAT